MRCVQFKRNNIKISRVPEEHEGKSDEEATVKEVYDKDFPRVEEHRQGSQ